MGLLQPHERHSLRHGPVDMTDFDLSRIRSIEGLDVKGKRVLVRADLNVPMQGGAVSDATRIERVLPTIRQLSRQGAKVIVLSHLGRPKNGPSPERSLKPVASKLKELMRGTPVHFVADCVGDEMDGRAAH